MVVQVDHHRPGMEAFERHSFFRVKGDVQDKLVRLWVSWEVWVVALKDCMPSSRVVDM